MTDSFANMVEHLAALLAFAQRERGSPSVSSLRMFDRVQPFTSNYVRVMGDLEQDADLSMLCTDVKPSDLGAPVDYAIIGDSSDPQLGGRTNAYFPIALRPLRQADMRHQRIPFLSAHHCRLQFGLLHYKGTYELGDRFASYHPREREWYVWGNGAALHHDAGISRRIQLVLGAQFTARYEWHAWIAVRPGMPAVSIPCTAKQAQRLFKARDLPPGASRRAALRHWCSEHFRARSVREEERASLVQRALLVHGHFRGVTDFDWEGMTCELAPPAFDVEKAAAAH